MEEDEKAEGDKEEEREERGRKESAGGGERKRGSRNAAGDKARAILAKAINHTATSVLSSNAATDLPSISPSQ